MINVEIRSPHANELEAMYYQRWQVLRQPLGKPLGSERDDADEKQIGVDYAIASGSHQNSIAQTSNIIIGSARLRHFDAGVGSIAYIAVLPTFSRQGIGTQLMKYLLNLAQQQKLSTVHLRSRLSAQVFYEKLGFTATSEPFTYIGIPHVKMEKCFSSH